MSEISEFEAFHLRAVKLIRKRENFLVVAEHEPYYNDVYSLIRTHEQNKGTWSNIDEQNYRSAQRRTHSCKKESNENQDWRDDNPAFDYLANNLFVQQAYSREITARRLMNAQYLEDGPLFKYHPEAAQILENLSTALMGIEWSKKWLAENVYDKPGAG